MEEKIAEKYNIPFFSINAIKLDRVHIAKNFKIPFALPKYISEAKDLLKKLQPQVIFSKGGYVSLPITFAAKSLKLPYVIHEADKTLGIANKLAAKDAKIVITSDKNCNKASKYITLGTPIRDEIFCGNPTKIVTKFKIHNKKPNILIVGGSLGAEAINTCVRGALEELTKKYNIVHITGKGKTKQIQMENYFQIDYTNDISDYYAWADIVVARAGAGVIAELKALQKKSILIPLPISASRGDQIENAKESGFYTISQEILTPQKLIDSIDITINSPPPKCSYDKNTNSKIVEQIISAVKK